MNGTLTKAERELALAISRDEYGANRTGFESSHLEAARRYISVVAFGLDAVPLMDRYPFEAAHALHGALHWFVEYACGAKVSDEDVNDHIEYSKALLRKYAAPVRSAQR